MDQDSAVLLQFIKQVVIYLVKTKLELEERAPVPNETNEYEIVI